MGGDCGREDDLREARMLRCGGFESCLVHEHIARTGVLYQAMSSCYSTLL